MKELQGTYGKDCKVFTDNIEPQALETIQKLLDNPVTEGKPVRIMPETLDESPMAYEPTEEIRSLIEPTVVVLDVIKPVINLKAK